MRSPNFVESLESRRLFAATLSGSGVLTVDGTESADNIVVRNHVPIDINVDVDINGSLSSFARSSIKLIVVNGLGGNDTIDLRVLAVTSRVYGGAGNDVIYGSPAADRISGQDGNDWINAGGGNDTLYGNAGADRLFGGDGKDYIFGGAGADLIRGQGQTDRITATKGIDDLRSNKGDIITNILE